MSNSAFKFDHKHLFSLLRRSISLCFALSLFFTHTFSQNNCTYKDLCLSPPLPPAFLPMEIQTVSASRSGNNYQIPFDTVVFNSVLGTKGFDIVICLEGVTNDAQIQLADNYVDSLVERFQNVAHYQPRFKYINIYRVARYSNESGAAWGFSGDTSVNNRYGTRYNAYNLPRLLIPEKHDTLFADAEEFVPEYDMVFLLVFDKKYGGSGISYNDERKVACFSIDEESGYHLSDEVAIHEMQHIQPFDGHGYLADEYVDTVACLIYDSIPLSPNYTADTINDRKWQHCLILPSVGFYSGAGICSGNFRPTPLCAMRQVYNFPDFCPVCRENSICYFDSIINPIYEISISPPSFTGSYTFYARVDTPSVNTFRYEWFFDDSLVASNVDSISVDLNSLSRTANHVLQFVCTDIDTHVIDTSLRIPWKTEWELLTKDSMVSIGSLHENVKLNLHPNPAGDRLYFSLTDKEPLISSVRIYSADGKQLMHLTKSTSHNPIDVSSLAPGVYIIEARTSTGKYCFQRFVKL